MANHLTYENLLRSLMPKKTKHGNAQYAQNIAENL
jgi:hypothetical protein